MAARIIGSVCVGLAAGALATAYGLQGWWLWTAGVGLLGVLWLVGYWRSWGWLASVGLVGSVAASAIGLLLDLPAGWMVAGLLAALCAWDLHRFVVSLETVDRVDDEGGLTRRHLARLGTVAGLGLVLVVVALGIEVRLTFLMASLLGLLAVWGLSQAVRFLRRESS
jgi:hypothetical protein